MKNIIAGLLIISLSSCKKQQDVKLNILNYENNKLKFEIINNSQKNYYFPINNRNLQYTTVNFIKNNGIYMIFKSIDGSKLEGTEVSYYPSQLSDEVKQDSIVRNKIPEFHNKTLSWISYYRNNFVNNIYLQSEDKIVINSYYNANYRLKKGAKYKLQLAIAVDTLELKKHSYSSLIEKLTLNNYNVYQGILFSNEISFTVK